MHTNYNNNKFFYHIYQTPTTTTKSSLFQHPHAYQQPTPPQPRVKKINNPPNNNKHIARILFIVYFIGFDVVQHKLTTTQCASPSPHVSELFVWCKSWFLAMRILPQSQICHTPHIITLQLLSRGQRKPHKCCALSMIILTTQTPATSICFV